MTTSTKITFDDDGNTTVEKTTPTIVSDGKTPSITLLISQEKLKQSPPIIPPVASTSTLTSIKKTPQKTPHETTQKEILPKVKLPKKQQCPIAALHSPFNNNLKQQSIHYLETFSNNKQTWKFKKHLQITLLRLFYLPQFLSDSQFKLFIAYCKNLPSTTKQLTLINANKILFHYQQSLQESPQDQLVSSKESPEESPEKSPKEKSSSLDKDSILVICKRAQRFIKKFNKNLN